VNVRRGLDRFSRTYEYASLSWLAALLFCYGCWDGILLNSHLGWCIAFVSALMFLILGIIANVKERPMATTTAPAKSTIVTTAEGDAKAFGDFLSKFIVSHPKTSVIVTAIVCLGLGFVFHI
jgi:hypothetical protein